MRNKKSKKKGRPNPTKIPRVQHAMGLSIMEGVMEELLERYPNEKTKAAAVRCAIYELLEIEEEMVENIDSNSYREKRKKQKIA